VKAQVGPQGGSPALRQHY